MGWKGCMDGQGKAKERHGSIEAGNYHCEGIWPLTVTPGELQRSDDVGFVLLVRYLFHQQ